VTLDQARAVADAVLYEGYLLYPYRAGSPKNRCRWQFGVLGPPGAAAAGIGEESGMEAQCLLSARPDHVTVLLRFLQLQVREVQERRGDRHVPVDGLTTPDGSLLSWDEAVAHEVAVGPDGLVEIPGGEEVEPVLDAGGWPLGRVVRRRRPLTARVRTSTLPDDGFVRLTVSVDNEHPARAADADDAIRTSLIGAHVLLQAHGAEFVSVIDPPPAARGAAERCRQRRCWPVLAGPDLVLGAPIILYDHPEVAAQSHRALFDSTEIDEILTLRVMTMTDEEKAEARATDPLAGAIVDHCDNLSEEDLRQLHGVLRGPLWDEDVDPETDSVLIDGVSVAKGSLVRVRPNRRADAQDIFLTGRVARVTAVLSDVDGAVHVGLVLVDDPAADLHDWYGRYLYFAPDELEPLAPQQEGRP
jgi:hypothetical protein